MIQGVYNQDSYVSLARMNASGVSLARIGQIQNNDVKIFLTRIDEVFKQMIFDESKAADQLKRLDQIISVVDKSKSKQDLEDLLLGFENYYKNTFLPHVEICLVQYNVQLPLKLQDVYNITNEDLKSENRPIFVGADSRKGVSALQRTRENKQYLICLDTRDNVFKNIIKFNQKLENYYTRICNTREQKNKLKFRELYKLIGNLRRDKDKLKFRKIEEQCEDILKKPSPEVQKAKNEIEKKISCIRMQAYIETQRQIREKQMKFNRIEKAREIVEHREHREGSKRLKFLTKKNY
ncbi:MAG: hypothetical protein CMP21_01505 [Rickettsiales bacterium]|nr:hypothetical protein [Rickettsiales bacterium]|tara:strand:+ start:17138 stop:18019 length:882 start_codon:yes stop_codon:yes gene_type:complete